MGGTSIPPSTGPSTPVGQPTPNITPNTTSPTTEKKLEPEVKPETCLVDQYGNTVRDLNNAGDLGKLINLFWAPFGAFGAYPNSGRDCPNYQLKPLN